MNLLNLSSKIVSAVKENKAKQGVVADAIAKAFGYKSHHAIQGDISLNVENKALNKPSDRTLRLVKAMEIAYSVDSISTEKYPEELTGDVLFDYYASLASNEPELLSQLITHEVIFKTLENLVNQLDLPMIDDNFHSHNACLMVNNLIPTTLPKEVVSATSMEVFEVDRPDMVFTSFLEDITNLKEVVFNHIAIEASNALRDNKAMVAIWGDETRCVEIDGVVINDDVFSLEKVEWKLVDVEEELYHIDMWLKEGGNPVQIKRFKEDKALLESLYDKFVWSHVTTNLYVSPSIQPDKFNEICNKVISENKLI